MPALGADMEVGTILEWLVKPGDAVKRGDIIAVVDTEKATVEVEVFETGIIQEIVVPLGEKVPIGTLLALIRTDGEVAAPPAAKPTLAVPPSKAAPAPTTPRPPAPAAVEKQLQPRTPPAMPGRLRISPLAMRTAVELKMDLSTVTGTGPHGAITRADIVKAAKAREAVSTPAPPLAERAPAAPAPTVDALGVNRERKPAVAPQERRAAMRKVIAAAMARSKREIPHYYLGTRIGMGRAMAWLQAQNLERPVTERLLYSVVLLKATALAAREIPEMNGFWMDGAFKAADAVHVGVAISLRQGGLIAPAIHDIDKKPLEEIMVNLRDLVKRVRAGVLRSSEIADATITVTSLGETGVETVFGIIYPPQVALVGFGKIVEQVWAVEGMLGAKPTVMATLAADHRASDGHRGGLFLAAVDRILQEPEKL
ncbi:MAG: dihydrolipoamide acetyltransferase family protein [Candidatus Binataceae bacterium]